MSETGLCDVGIIGTGVDVSVIGQTGLKYKLDVSETGQTEFCDVGVDVSVIGQTGLKYKIDVSDTGQRGIEYNL